MTDLLEEAVLEALAARYRLGENVWTFKDSFQPTLEGLAAKGLVWWKPGVIEHTVLAGLEEAGKSAVLSPTYAPPRITTHPLDDEDVLVTVTLVHTPTGATVAVSEYAPCDSDPTTSQVLASLFNRSMDALLVELESR